MDENELNLLKQAETKNRRPLYRNKKIHKHVLKQRHAKLWNIFDVKEDERKQKQEYQIDQEKYPRFVYRYPRRNGGYEYWKTFYRSGARKFAKQQTNKRIRQKYRQLISNTDHEDVKLPKQSDYEKEYDFWWTID